MLAQDLSDLSIARLPHLDRAEQLRRHHLGPTIVGDQVEVVRLGLLYRMPAGMVERRAGTDDWLFMCFHDPVDLGIGQVASVQSGPSLAIWAPGQEQRYGQLRGSWRHSWLHARGPLAEATGRRLGPGALPLGGIVPAITRLRALSDQVLGDPDPTLVGCCAAMFLRMLERCTGTSSPLPADWLVAARAFLDSRYTEPIRLTALAHRLGRSPAHLAHAFRAWLGCSPKAYLIARRLDAAAWRLRHTAGTVESIAHGCGFADRPHFTRLFRRRFACSPLGWRGGR